MTPGDLDWYPPATLGRTGALALLDAALRRVDRLTPAEVRPAIELWLRATHDRVRLSPVESLLGQPVVAVLQFAHALVEATDAEDARRDRASDGGTID